MMNNVTEKLTEAMALFRITDVISFRKTPIPKSELYMLVYIVKYMDRGTVTPVSLANRFRCSKAYISRTLNSLEKRRLITRTANTADRRSRLVLPTEQGINVVSGPMGEYTEVVSGLVDKLGEKDSARLCELLTQATEILISMPLRKTDDDDD